MVVRSDKNSGLVFDKKCLGFLYRAESRHDNFDQFHGDIMSYSVYWSRVALSPRPVRIAPATYWFCRNPFRTPNT